MTDTIYVVRVLPCVSSEHVKCECRGTGVEIDSDVFALTRHFIKDIPHVGSASWWQSEWEWKND